MPIDETGLNHLMLPPAGEVEQAENFDKIRTGEEEMKIASSDIQMASINTFSAKTEQTENLEIWKGKRPSPPANANADRAPGVAVGRFLDGDVADRVTLSSPRQAPRAYGHIKQEAVQQCDDCSQSESSDGLTDQLSVLKMLVERLTGRKINIVNYENLNRGNVDAGANVPVQSTDGQVQTEQGWGISYDSHESYSEVQTASFASQGTIKTTDGQEINFSLNLEMSREYYQESNVSFRAGDAVQKDPLVINFNGSAAELTDTKFSFDLDVDGTEDNISFVRPGSGFLVFDKNQDGVVNDGSELFGPGTGNGFSELAAYDSDNNNWIDENDAIYDKLSVWTKNDQGEDELSSLQAKNVGAIYLSSAKTLFDLKDENNQSNGQIAATGIYADEEGGVKTVQHLNLTI